MARLIDADDLMACVIRKHSEVGKIRYTEGFNDAILRVRSMIHSAKTIDAVPVRNGRWININDSEKYQCSECGITMWFPKSLDVTPDTYIFCPHCGAEMTEEKKKSGRTNHERTNKGYLR